MFKETLENKILRKITQGDRHIYLREDFENISGYDQVGLVLRTLTRKGILIRLGYGIYARAATDRNSGEPVPAHPQGNCGILCEALERLGEPYTVDNKKVRPSNPGFTRRLRAGKLVINGG